MRHALTAVLSGAAISALCSFTPAAAQVAGNPGDLHTPTPYTQEYWGQQSYGSYGPFAPFGAVAGGMGAVIAAPFGGGRYAMAPGPACGVIHDFNGRYTSVCGL